MSARDDLFKGLIEHACCFDDEEANKLLDAFAHELAERLRNQRHDDHDQIKCVPCAIFGQSADLIAPQRDSP